MSWPISEIQIAPKGNKTSSESLKNTSWKSGGFTHSYSGKKVYKMSWPIRGYIGFLITPKTTLVRSHRGIFLASFVTSYEVILETKVVSHIVIQSKKSIKSEVILGFESLLKQHFFESHRGIFLASFVTSYEVILETKVVSHIVIQSKKSIKSEVILGFESLLKQHFFGSHRNISGKFCNFIWSDLGNKSRKIYLC